MNRNVDQIRDALSGAVAAEALCKTGYPECVKYLDNAYQALAALPDLMSRSELIAALDIREIIALIEARRYDFDERADDAIKQLEAAIKLAKGTEDE